MFAWLFAKPDRDLSPSDLERQIEQRKKQAVKSGVAGAFLRLYFDSWRYLPSWIQNAGGGDWCHPWITEARKDATKGRVELKLKGQSYVVTSKEYDPIGRDSDTGKELELSIDGSLCLGIGVSIKYGEYADTESLSYVTAFVPGAWVNDVLLLSRETRLLHERRMREFEARSAKHSAKRFGL